jgi:PAS domain S-box-containing protein
MKHEKKPTILIVDDEPANIAVIVDYLGEKGLKILIAPNGTKALQQLEYVQPDLILLDIMLPDIDGFEVCHRLKTNEATREIPVIFMTALTETRDKIKGFDLGGVDYITKPFQPKEVLARVNAHLTIRKLYQELQQEHDRFQSLSEATFEGILIHDDGTIIEVNQAIVNMTGYLRSELIGMNALDLLTPTSGDEVTRRTQSGDTEPYEVRGIKRDGTNFPIEIQTRDIVWQGRTINLIAVRDISWRKVLEQKTHQLESENLTLRATLHDRDHFGDLVGKSPVMQKIYEYLVNAAASDETVIIYGETGTGKELAARTIFELSEQHKRTFISVNCGALQESLFEALFFGYRKGAFTGAERDTPGYFERTQEGTLFLDEIGELTLTMQAKLLRVLQDGEYTPLGATASRIANVRIIAATNRELRELKREGKLREDFFQRIHVVAMEMPPLRQHKEDIPLLITHFLKQRTASDTATSTIPPDIIEQLCAYDWPGNVRELYNELRRYLATGEVELRGESIEPSLSASEVTVVPRGRTFNDIIGSIEKQLITDALTQTQGNKTKAAQLLQIPLITLHRKIKKYAL